MSDLWYHDYCRRLKRDNDRRSVSILPGKITFVDDATRVGPLRPCGENIAPIVFAALSTLVENE